MRKRAAFESIGSSLDDLINDNAIKAESAGLDFAVSFVDKEIEGIDGRYEELKLELATLEEYEDE